MMIFLQLVGRMARIDMVTRVVRIAAFLSARVGMYMIHFIRTIISFHIPLPHA